VAPGGAGGGAVVRLRIAHVTATFPPYYGGTGTVCFHNALGLARLGHDVTVFTAAGAVLEPDDPPGVTVRRLPALFRLGNAPCLPGLLGLGAFDVVHLHYPFYFGAEAVFLRSLVRGQRYVVTYHQDVLFAGPLRGLERLHHRLLGRRILGRARKVLATSWDYARASRLGEMMRRVPEKVGELPNGVDVERFHPGLDGGSLRAHYGLRQRDRVLLFVGGLDRAHYFKGVDVLLRALARTPGGDVRLFLVGEGDLRERYARQAAELGLADRVTFCGRVPEAELPAHYALGDLLVLPSTTLGEAFGVVLLEAMACAKAVVASHLPGVRAVVSDGEDGLLAHPGDPDDLAAKIQALLEDPARRRAMGARGRAKVEARYAWPAILPRLVAVYEAALADGSRRA
jgi:glycosyltransferase involved in cell wall biosynthesis